MNGYPLFDLHEDISSYYLRDGGGKPGFEVDGERHADLPKYRRGRVKAVVGAVFPAAVSWSGDRPGYTFTFDSAWRQIAFYHRLVRLYDELFLIKSAEDLGRDGIGILMGLEGAYPVATPEDLDLFATLGLRVLGLTWNVDNVYAASCMSKKDYGLTGMGARLIDKAEELGIVVDLAHSSRKAILDAISVAEKPLIISHTAVYSLRRHPRNVTDRVLDALAQNGGVVGITFVSSFLSRRGATARDVAKHVLYVANNFGPDHVAIGTDYFGTDELPAGLENIGKITSLYRTLIDMGAGHDLVEKLAWKNAERVFREALPRGAGGGS